MTCRPSTTPRQTSRHASSHLVVRPTRNGVDADVTGRADLVEVVEHRAPPCDACVELIEVLQQLFHRQGAHVAVEGVLKLGKFAPRLAPPVQQQEHNNNNI